MEKIYSLHKDYSGGSLLPPRLCIPYNITSLAKEVMFLVVLVYLFVCLSVCGQHYPKIYEWIGMKFCGGVLGSTLKN